MQKRVLPVLFGTLLLDMIGTGMIFPIIPIIFTDPSSSSFLLQGYSVQMQYFIAGLITALFGLMQFIGSPILGEISDVYGRKKLLTLGVGVLAISNLLFGFGIEIGALWLLLVSRTVAGLAGANFSIAQATIADVTPPQDRAKNFGLIGAAFGIGFILGPLLGGYIASFAHNPAAPFWFAGLLGIVNLVFITIMLPETNHNRKVAERFNIFKGLQNIKAAFGDKDAAPLYLSSFLYWCGFSFFTSFIGILLVNRYSFDEAGIGTFFGVVGVCIVITQLFILRILARKYDERTILRYSIPFVALAIFVYPFAPGVALLYLLIPFLSVPQGLSMANMQALISKGVSADKQGAALGINGSLVALSQGLIPLLAGVGGAFFGVTGPFVAGALLVGGSWSVLFLRRRR